MAAPTYTARTDPSNTATQRRLTRGHRSTLAFSSSAACAAWEVDVGMFGLDQGEPIKISTQHNDTWHQFTHQVLVEATPFDTTFMYDPIIFNQYMTSLRFNQAITRHMPDGSYFIFWGFCQNIKLDPHPNEGAEPPMGTMTVIVSNYDPSDASEHGYVYVGVTGT